MAEASALVRDELGKQAESLRQLMLAVQPLGRRPAERARCRARGLTAPIEAYVDGLYGDRRGPCLTVNVEDDLVLDWPTETLVMRIVQEAVSNVLAPRRRIAADRDAPVPSARWSRSRWPTTEPASIRPPRCSSQASRSCGRARPWPTARSSIDSAPGTGTRVIARLGADEAGGRTRPSSGCARRGTGWRAAASVDEA